MVVPVSLYDQPQGSVFEAATNWALGTLFGSLAISLCVIAVAFFGLAMLSGRVSLRRGAILVLGCFLLLGAGQIAQGLVTLPQAVGTRPEPVVMTFEAKPAKPLPPANYDPYAGASLRRD